jgi:hypothetical protein
MIRKTGKVIFNILIICQLAFYMFSCNGAAKDPANAADILLNTKSWKIDQILVNDAVTFTDGKMIHQFGGIEFERYMETVQFKPEGKFEGIFKGEVKPMELEWKINEKDVSIAAAGEEGGAWSILPADVTTKSFTMTTRSTAYDYPRMTKVALIFKAGN